MFAKRTNKQTNKKHSAPLFQDILKRVELHLSDDIHIFTRKSLVPLLVEKKQKKKTQCAVLRVQPQET